MPGTLSTESPVIACRSIIFSGGTPHFSMTSGMPICLSFIGSYIDTVGPTSCIRSLSEEMMVVSRAGLAGQARIGGDQIVGLETFHLDARQVEGAGRLADQAELRDEILRRRRAVCLVFGIEFVAECLRRIVEDHGEMRRAYRRRPCCALPAAASTACCRNPTPRRPANRRICGSAAAMRDRRGRCSRSRRRGRDDRLFSWRLRLNDDREKGNAVSFGFTETTRGNIIILTFAHHTFVTNM